ncbi:MAG: hypothetical protein ICV69_03655 [Thermoleophilaceae bacterium]|nr:hypothetical protein [Thermoleophilaceae bacterium]
MVTPASTGSRPITPLADQPGDSVAVRAVAALDSSQAPGCDALAGELNGEIVAVITIRDGILVADPFRASTAVIDLLTSHRATVSAQV